MRWNEAEVAAHLASKPPDWEGRLCYKPAKASGSFALQPIFKERYFKLLGNLLFCLKLGPTGKGETVTLNTSITLYLYTYIQCTILYISLC